MSREWAHSIAAAETGQPGMTGQGAGIGKATGQEAGAGHPGTTSHGGTTGKAAGQKAGAVKEAAAGAQQTQQAQSAAGSLVGKESSAAEAVSPRVDEGLAGEASVRSLADSLALRSDSLCRAAEPAYSREADAFHYTALDSLRFGWSTSGAVRTRISPLPGRDTTAQALFGTESCTIQPDRLERPVGDSFTDNAVFQGFVLLLAATYATLLYRNLGDVRTLLKRISRDSAAGGERLSEEPGASGFSRFLNITAAIGMLFMGVVVVKYGDTLMPPELGRALSHAAVLALSLLATLSWGAIILFQGAVIRIAGAITLARPFIAQLSLLRRTYFALAVIITSPTLILFALCPRGTGGAWFIIGAVELIITAVLYLRESLNLFISKKISILHWFLYLCTVEVFPISLLWLLATR